MRFWIPLAAIGSAVVSLMSPSSVQAQAAGLTQRPNVAPYLNGVMPPQPPTLGSDWSTVVAFPNLTFVNLTGVTQMPGQPKMVAWEREGKVYSFDKNPAAATKTLILDVSANCQGWDDSGLLGLAFHPKFSLGGEPGTNRYVFIWYTWAATVQGSPTTRPPTSKPVRDRLMRFTLNANGVADPASGVIFIDQNGSNVWHNGGGMFFHPDNGFLYITNGDDQNAGGNSQTITGGLFSGVLRIDVDRLGGAISHPAPRAATGAGVPSTNYFIPNDNPFVGVPNANEEFFALGLRSPHRMTIDPLTKRIFIGDVGAGAREEITVIEPNDPPGLNLQWSRIEGLNGDLVPPYVGVNKRPIIDYGRSEGVAVVGGYVYRGQEFAAELGGRYIFGDNVSGTVWVLDESVTPPTKVVLTALPDGSGPNSGSDYTGLSSFGLDSQGELYLCQMSSLGGRIYKLQRGGTPSQPLPATLTATGVFSDVLSLTPSDKLIPYGLNEPFWSDGAVKSRWAVVPSAAKIGFQAKGEWAWPEGSVLVKHFELPVDDSNPQVRKRLETRLLVQTATATYGATYKWRADNTEADLMDSAITENVAITTAPVGNLVGADIGSPGQAGSTTRAGDVVTVNGGGGDIWGNADQFHFAHQQRTGDFDISVRMESLEQTDLYAKAGLMARESLAAGSRHVLAMAFPSNAARNNNDGGFEFQYRTAANGTSLAIYPAQPQPRVTYPNTWLRLRREGNLFIGYSSVDGVWWGEFARHTLALPQTVYFGIAITAHNNAQLATGKFHLANRRYQPWYYPSRNDCTTCHTSAAGGVLGPKTRQLNGNYHYPNGVIDNQIRAWAGVGLFNNPPQPAQIPSLDKLVAHDDPQASSELKARSYLDANCASCHRPGGVQAFWDARFDTPLNQQGLLYGQVSNTLGDPTARVITPQDLMRSILHRRVNTVGANQMPPIARNMIDQSGVEALAEWIGSLQPNAPPVVTLHSPANNSTYLTADPILLSATAADSDGILKVEFYAGEFKIGEDATAPYQAQWIGAGAGIHQVRAVAVDTIGNSGASAIARVSVQATPLPAPWIHQDVGSVAMSGDATYASGTFTVTGSGADIWGTADGFHFMYRPLTGDGEITARVLTQDFTDGWAKAGVMIRETLDAGSRSALVAVTPGNGVAFQRRATPNGDSLHTAGPGGTAPRWLRLVRSGNNLVASASMDGAAWTVIGSQQITMAATVHVGLAITSHNDATLGESTFDNVSVTNGSPTYLTKINFQPAAASIPAGYMADSGALFAPRAGGLKYGWNRDNSVDAFDRNHPASPDQLYDTLVQLQTLRAGIATSKWEMEVPNARYRVRVVAGDPSNFGDTHHLTAENVSVVNATSSAAAPFVDAQATVTVTDGRLTIQPGASAVNSKICFVEITSFDVVANVAPTISLVTPSANQVYRNPASITFAAKASDVENALARVEFMVDGTKVGEDFDAPYSIQWTAPTYGTHSVTARAVDSASGMAAASNSMTVQIEGTAGFRGEYFDDANLSQPVLVRADGSINFTWGGGSPDPRIAVDTFSVRWTGQVRPRFTQRHTFTTDSDDGVRLWVNGTLLIDKWLTQGQTRHTGVIDLQADVSYEVVLEYFENAGSAAAKLLWSSDSMGEEPIPSSRTTVPVPPNLPPAVELTAPFASGDYLLIGTIQLTAEAADPDGTITRVEFWVDGAKIGEDLTTPFAGVWAGPRAEGAHTLHAVAYDDAGLSVQSQAITITASQVSLTVLQVQRLANPVRSVARLQVKVPAGRGYAIDWTTDVTAWQQLQTGTGAATPVEIIDSAENSDRRFYRLRLTN